MLAALWIAASGLLPAGAAQAAPAWVSDPCAGIDCSTTLAGVGQADLLPDIRISSAIAYAEAARQLSSVLEERLAMGSHVYGERAGQLADSALKSVVESPLGAALTKTYGDADDDMISVAVTLNPISDPAVKAYAQEFLDVSSATLWVRLLMTRSSAEYFQDVSASSAAATSQARATLAEDDAALEARLSGELIPWAGQRWRVSSQDIRAGSRNEYILWAEDQDARLAWEESWPYGGASLLKDGQVAARYVFDSDLNQWEKVKESGGK